MRIELDKRATGQGKSHDMIEYIFNNPDKRCLLISPNVSNINDFCNDSIKSVETKENVRELLHEYLENIKNNNINSIIILRERLDLVNEIINGVNIREVLIKYPNLNKEFLQLPNSKKLQANLINKIKKLENHNQEIDDYLIDNDEYSDFIKATLFKFIQELYPCINSFFATEKVIIEDKESHQVLTRMPIKAGIFYGNHSHFATHGCLPEVKDENCLSKMEVDDKDKLNTKIRLDYKSLGVRKALQLKTPRKYDVIFIDEADKTLGSVSLKTDKTTFSGVIVDYKELQEDYLKYPQYYIHYPNYITDCNKTLPCNIIDSQFMRKGSLDILRSRGISFKIVQHMPIEPISLEIQHICNLFKEISNLYNSSYIERQEYTTSQGVKVVNKEEYNFSSVNVIKDFLNNHLEENGKIVLLGATHNNIIDNFCKNEEVNNLQLPVHITPIKYYLHKVNNTTRIPNDVFTIVKNKNTQTQLIKEFRNNRQILLGRDVYYFTSTILRGSNTLGTKGGCYFNFKLSEIRKAPCNSILSYFNKIGNQYLLNESDVKKAQSNYFYKEEEFERFKINNIKQILGRLNRGRDAKHIYYIDDKVGIIIKDYITNKLKQELIIVD